MKFVRRIAVWSAVVALVGCGLNTPEELRLGREAIKTWRKGSGRPGDRIFGGFVTYVSLYPFAVYIMAKDARKYWECSGSVVAPEWILSAAHCMSNLMWTGVVFAGDVDFTTDRVFTKNNIQIRVIRQAFQFLRNDTLRHDIMMVKLTRRLVIEEGFVETIPLTDVKAYPANFKETCTIVGFGMRGRTALPETGIQRGASFLMEPGKNCRAIGIRENGLCTFEVKRKSACMADSGGPIFCSTNMVQFGVVVGAIYENCSIYYCGAPCMSNIHMFVGYYRDWIVSYITPPGETKSAGRRASAALLAQLSTSFLLCLLNSPINALTPL